MVLEIPGKLFNQTDVRETPVGTLTSAQAAPIGSILAWLKSFANTPSLPAGWVECDGATLSDSASVYNGQAIPDLNGDGRFLQGGDTSGGTGGATQQLLADDGANNLAVTGTKIAWFGGGMTTGQAGVGLNTAKPFIDDGRPVFYDVVWIMRVK